MDIQAYETRARSGPCFVCAFLAGHPQYRHETVYEDHDHVAFQDRWPTLPGKVIDAPKAHLEHVVRDLEEKTYTRLMLVARTVALAVESVIRPERIYLLSLGSQQGNAHLHWHIAGLPPGVPYQQQQYHALMAENGVLTTTPEQAGDIASEIRAAIVAQ